MADNSKVLAALAHGLGIITAFLPIAALIIWLIKKDDDAFVAEHCKQAMNFQFTITIVNVVLTITILGIMFLGWAVGIFAIVMTILAIMPAAKGEEYAYPKWTAIPFFK